MTAARTRELNESIRYTLYAVFRARTDSGRLGPERRVAAAEEADALFEQAREKDVELRGSYDVSALRADADLLLWLVGPSADELQNVYARFRHTALGRACEPVWSAMALHRPAEFNKSHIPAYVAGEAPLRYVCVYPFVRSYEWYLLPEAERRELLAEHGRMAREFPDVRANTAAAFALGDYEWMLAFEADELHRIVDLMRHLRGARARWHTRIEVPFYTGCRKPMADLVADLP
ncbi:MAG TPA: hydrogen peroxide-dependent heme synthase [Mycobacteriales bacterium]|nr:hydrogen peroxide-dependent heme synthase [Mycobacteriales bacterium]